jgi:FMN hydrolase / 5-amino-6-(5-phospho-D-ribitylamino)uracil phosphatase
VTSCSLAVPVLTEIRALAFDLDNTLWDVEPVLARAERRLLDWLREHWPRIPERFTAEDMRVARHEIARERPERAHDFNFLRIEAMARHARACGYHGPIAEQAFEVFFTARNEIDAYRDVEPALARLRERYVLASLSNGNADLGRVGLAQYFALSLNSRAIGAAKPDRRAFEALVAALGFEAREVAYAGDDPFLDVEGARGAGLPAIWVNRRRALWPTALPAPLLEVRDCGELADALIGAERARASPRPGTE